MADPKVPIATISAGIAAMLACRDAYSAVYPDTFPYRMLCKVITGEKQTKEDVNELARHRVTLIRTGADTGPQAAARYSLDAVSACLEPVVDEKKVRDLAEKARSAIGVDT